LSSSEEAKKEDRGIRAEREETLAQLTIGDTRIRGRKRNFRGSS